MLAVSWHIELLGRLRATAGETRVEQFRTQKTGALLAYLALFSPHRTVTREELAAVFWPDSAPAQADHSLRQALSWLRTRLEPPGVAPGSVLVAPPRAGSVALHPAVFTTDVAHFERALREARKPGLSPAERAAALRLSLALYTGSLLPGVYEDWAQTERERLAARRDLAEQELAQLVPEPAIPDQTTGLSVPLATSLPMPINRFWGRAEELALLSNLLAEGQNRLLTITGPGGWGKTRLAVEVARQASDRFAGGTFWVPLADLPTSAPLSEALAVALHLPPAPGKSNHLQRAIAALQRRARTLLLLDNAEPFVAEAGSGIAADVAQLLSYAANVTCLVTSRVPLGVMGEQEIALSPLPTPAEIATTPEALLETPAVRMLADRAQAVRRDFAVTERNAPVIQALCARLGGVPLALELAAARLRTLTPQALLHELTDTGGVLDHLGGRDSVRRPERHRSLRAALSGSFRALSLPAREAVAALTLFRGGWTAEAAHAALPLPTPDPLLSEIAALAWSMSTDGERFFLPEPLKEYASEQLTDALRHDFLQQHARYFARFAARAAQERYTDAQIAWLERLLTERENLRLALDTLTATDPPTALVLATDLAWFWRRRGDWSEGYHHLRRLLATPTDGASGDMRIHAQIGLGDLCWAMGKTGEAEAAFRTARAWASDTPGASYTVARAAERLGRFLADHGERQEARALLTAAREWFEETGDMRGSAKCLGGLALLSHYAGDYLAARQQVRDALAGMTRVGDLLEQVALLHLQGWCGEPEETDAERVTRCGRLLAATEQTGDKAMQATALLSLGEAHRLAGSLEASRATLARGAQLARQVGATLDEALLRGQEGVTARLLGALTDAEVAHRDALTLACTMTKGHFSPHLRTLSADYAVLLRAQGRSREAARIHAAIAGWSERTGLPLPVTAERLHQSECAFLRAALGAVGFTDSWKAGYTVDAVPELFSEN